MQKLSCKKGPPHTLVFGKQVYGIPFRLTTVTVPPDISRTNAGPSLLSEILFTRPALSTDIKEMSLLIGALIDSTSDNRTP